MPGLPQEAPAFFMRGTVVRAGKARRGDAAVLPRMQAWPGRVKMTAFSVQFLRALP